MSDLFRPVKKPADRSASTDSASAEMRASATSLPASPSSRRVAATSLSVVEPETERNREAAPSVSSSPETSPVARTQAPSAAERSLTETAPACAASPAPTVSRPSSAPRAMAKPSASRSVAWRASSSRVAKALSARSRTTSPAVPAPVGPTCRLAWPPTRTAPVWEMPASSKTPP